MGLFVLVSNGVYNVGGMAAGGGALPNRVVITNAITVAKREQRSDDHDHSGR